MRNISIREFVPQDRVDDREALLTAFLDIWNTSENLKFLSYTLKPFEPEMVRFWLENHKEQGGRYFCATGEDGEIFGISIVKVSGIDGFELYGTGVRPELKRQGIGCQLVAYSVNEAKNLDFNAVDVAVFADNVPMLRLLLSLGFVPVNMDFRKRADGADVVYLKRYL